MHRVPQMCPAAVNVLYRIMVDQNAPAATRGRMANSIVGFGLKISEIEAEGLKDSSSPWKSAYGDAKSKTDGGRPSFLEIVHEELKTNPEVLQDKNIVPTLKAIMDLIPDEQLDL